ncbi:aldo/keto reductase [Halobaculum sp. CBA1158]|uniref:aldo/keto reductase n=1 Tax=Halobaculum sp. CBA1158 TaxID=2904243 RepID=UPI001F1BB0F7|nr:aldo/keto reductase [Halobaculum sp. CBA1158]UIP01167.1 aldo/keto reductase [Halobaculum sp. CBA1158]
MATARGTWGYRDRFGDAVGRTYFRRFGPGVVSSIGLGTALGDPDDATDDRYRRALATGLDASINVVDTASNYRCGRAERVVGEALAGSGVPRESVVIASKVGHLPFDGSRPDDPGRYVRERYVDTGLVDADDLARGGHALTPALVDATLDRSLEAVGVDAIDCYYVHEPEAQLAVRDRAAVYDQVETAFETLERRRAAGDIGMYGVATWDAFRVPPDHESHLDLAELLARAEAAADAVGVEDHGLRAIQLPFNVRMAGAFTVAAHDADGADGPVSALEFCHREGLSVVAAAALAGGDLAEPDAIPEGVATRLAGDTPAQRALNFARSAPAVTTALVGCRRRAHVREAVAAGTFDPLGASAFDAVFE